MLPPPFLFLKLRSKYPTRIYSQESVHKIAPFLVGVACPARVLEKHPGWNASIFAYVLVVS